MFFNINAFAQHADTLFVYFDINKSELSASNLDKVIQLLDSKKKIVELTIAAYADSTGNTAKNYSLSLSRMNVVKKILVTQKPEFINVVNGNAYGETTKFGSDLQKNRCVEIIIKHQQIRDIGNIGSYEKGEKIVLENILFENNSHVFIPSSIAVLQTLVEALKANPTIKIMIQGHVCCGGNNPDYDMIEPGSINLKISETRAKAVCDYLLEKGINSDRLKYSGLSFKFPLVFPEKTEEDRAKNRRVEIEIM